MSAHAEFLRVAAEDRALAEGLKRGFRSAALAPRNRALLELIETLALAPWEIAAADWQRLRLHGWRDTELAHAVLGAAHFNYLNRMADGLGIQFEYPTELEPFQVPGEARAPTRPGRAKSTPTASAGAATPFVSLDAAAAAAARSELAPRLPAGLAEALAVNIEAARGIAAWRDYEWTPTGRFDLPARVRVAGVVADALHCDTARDHLAQRAARAGVALAPGADPFAHFLDEHALRLTQSPHTARREHVEALRAGGFADEDVLGFTRFVAYLNFEYRALLGLGVPPEPLGRSGQ